MYIQVALKGVNGVVFVDSDEFKDSSREEMQDILRTMGNSDGYIAFFVDGRKRFFNSKHILWGEVRD